jgi:hypothetical protein
MVVCSSSYSEYIIKHNLNARQIVDESIASICDAVPKMNNTILALADYRMGRDMKLDFAQKCLPAKFSPDFLATHEVNLPELIAPQRDDDKRDDLYCTFNIIQEKFIKGGVMITKLPPLITNAPVGEDALTINMEESAFRTFEPRRSRLVRSPVSDVTINRALWKIAEEYYTANN